MTEAYPLQWPDGWPRSPESTRGYLQSQYNRPGWDKVVRRLLDELKRLGAKNIVLSTNQPIRRDGLPYAQQRRIGDPGAAVYFLRAGRQLVMAQDRFLAVDDNIRSLALAIEGMRQMERHGGATMMDKAFAGFEALPAPPKWRQILGLDEEGVAITLDRAEAHYRQLAKTHHPDRGGDAAMFATLNEAINDARRELR